MEDLSKYEFGGFDRSSINMLRLISELEVHINFLSIWDSKKIWIPLMK